MKKLSTLARAAFLSAAFSLTAFTSALADVTGKWTCNFIYLGSSYPQDLSIYQVGSKVTGQELSGNSPFATIVGTVSGSQFNFVSTYTSGGYVATVTGTVSGNSMSGSWTSNVSQAGSFTCTKTSNTPASVTPKPAGAGGSSKRPTAINIFCNRTGVNLETADCSVTVGDSGPPTRTTPTGIVDLSAKNGFFPAVGQCALQQTAFSPGVASCKAQFAIPVGFPLGIAFPIDATYPGDTDHEGASTSHATIQAGCVGTPTKPCSGAVALTFADIPQILKNAIATVFECGQATIKKNNTRSIFGDIGKCVGSVSSEIKLGEVLAKMDLTQIQSLGNLLSNKDVRGDPLLKAVDDLSKEKYREAVQKALGDQQKLSDLIIKIVKDNEGNTKDIIQNIRALPLVTRAKKKSNYFKLGTKTFTIKNNKRGKVGVALTKPARKLVAALKKAGKGDLNVIFTIKGQRSSGPKRKFNKSFTVAVGVR